MRETEICGTSVGVSVVIEGAAVGTRTGTRDGVPDGSVEGLDGLLLRGAVGVGVGILMSGGQWSLAAAAAATTLVISAAEVLTWNCAHCSAAK